MIEKILLRHRHITFINVVMINGMKLHNGGHMKLIQTCSNLGNLMKVDIVTVHSLLLDLKN